MGLIRTKDGRNVSVAECNGYSVEKVRKAKQYLREIGKDRRNFPIERLVDMYNDIKGTMYKPTGCKPCQASKYYVGLQNYVTYGELTLINNGKATEEDLNIDIKVEEEPKEEEVAKLTPAERMAKAREAKKKKKEEENDRVED